MERSSERMNISVTEERKKFRQILPANRWGMGRYYALSGSLKWFCAQPASFEVGREKNYKDIERYVCGTHYYYSHRIRIDKLTN